jgi:hypothetical protein
MSVHVDIDTNRKLVIVTYTGEISEAEAFGAARLERSHPDFDSSFSEICDLSGVTGDVVSSFAVEQLARRQSIFSRTSRHVVVAPQPHVFGRARMAEVYAEELKPHVIVVRTVNEAYKVLGLEAEQSA